MIKQQYIMNWTRKELEKKRQNKQKENKTEQTKGWWYLRKQLSDLHTVAAGRHDMFFNASNVATKVWKSLALLQNIRECCRPGDKRWTYCSTFYFVHRSSPSFGKHMEKGQNQPTKYMKYQTSRERAGEEQIKTGGERQRSCFQGRRNIWLWGNRFERPVIPESPASGGRKGLLSMSDQVIPRIYLFFADQHNQF